MLYETRYTHYKSGNSIFGFIGTQKEFSDYTSEQGGIFEVVSKSELTSDNDIGKHAAYKGKSLEDNPFNGDSGKDESALAKKWESEFNEYQDFILAQEKNDPEW